MGSTSPELLAECARRLGPVRMAELYLKGVSGAYRDRGATFEALSYTERLVVWDGEHEAEAAAVASAGRAEAENAGAEAAQGERRVSEAARILDIAQFLADNPGIDISSLRPRVFPSYTYLPGEECRTCHGDRDGRRCLLSPECRFRYRAGFFTRQHGICPWCAEPLPGDLNTERGRGGLTSTVATDHIIPLTRGGPKHAEWNKQLLHEKCNTSKGNHVTAPALAVAAEHDVEVLDFLAVCQHPAPMPHGAVVHLFTPLIGYDGIFRSPLGRVGCRFRALCGHSFGADWFPVHGSPPPATCQRCREHRERLGAGNAPACAGECCAS